MNVKRPKAILFDWDNTLADSWPIIHDALNITLEKMGHEIWTIEDIISGREGIHHSLRDSFPRLFGERWEEAKQHYYEAFLSVHLERIKPLAGAEDVLKQLKEAGIYTAIVSNKTGDYLRQEVSHMGWDHYFNKVVGATDAKADKPFADPIHLALEGSGIKAGYDVWMVGDSATDIEAALNSGCEPHLFGTAPMPELLLADPRLKNPITNYKDHTALTGALSSILL